LLKIRVTLINKKYAKFCSLPSRRWAQAQSVLLLFSEILHTARRSLYTLIRQKEETTSWTTEKSGFDSLHGQEISKLAERLWGQTILLFNGYLFSWEFSGQGVKLTTP
jgi:hypothetical protein